MFSDLGLVALAGHLGFSSGLPHTGVMIVTALKQLRSSGLLSRKQQMPVKSEKKPNDTLPSWLWGRVEDTPAVTHMVLGGKTKQQKLICRLSGFQLVQEDISKSWAQNRTGSFLAERQTQLSDVSATDWGSLVVSGTSRMRTLRRRCWNATFSSWNLKTWA